MNQRMLGFCAAILSSLLWPTMPSLWLLPVALCCTILLMKQSFLLSGCMFGVVWMLGFSHYYLPAAPEKQLQPISMKGEIISLVWQNSDRINLVIRAEAPSLSPFAGRKWQLYWQMNQHHLSNPIVGDVWQFEIRPKSISSVLNQGGFNQQKYRLSQHIVGRGNVIGAVKMSASPSIRIQVIQRLLPIFKGLPQGDIILALLVGDKQLIEQPRWESLRRTGSGHLVAISGLHLSVVGMWSLLLFQLVLRVFRPRLDVQNLTLATLASFSICFVYAYFAGFALATQRALIMIFMVMMISLARQYSSPWERLLWALFGVLLVDPFSILGAGFWLSFCALAIILLVVGSSSAKAKAKQDSRGQNQLFKHDNKLDWRTQFFSFIKQFWAIQWRLSLGLGLIQAILFGGFSLHSLLANLLLVPWFSLVAIPISIASFIAWGALYFVGVDWGSLFVLADISLLPLVWLSELSVSIPGGWVHLSALGIAQISFVIFAATAIFLCTTRHWRLLFCLTGVPLLASIWFHMNQSDSVNESHLLVNKSSQNNQQRILRKTIGTSTMEEGSNPQLWKLHLLDVGQGLSAVVESEGRALIYDTGSAFGRDFSYAKRVVLPFLAYKGIRVVDYLFLSHSDNDHSGGAQIIIDAFPKATVVSDQVEYPGPNCRPAQLEWQGLTVSLLAPRVPRGGNNGSCVIRISDNQSSVLLPGDIELSAENKLLASIKDLSSQILIAPHHGSRTSSSPAFVNAVNPELVLFAAGFNNRWGFPKADIVARYGNAKTLVTGQEGQISISFTQGHTQIKTYRKDLAPFWYNRLFGFGESDDPE